MQLCILVTIIHSPYLLLCCSGVEFVPFDHWNKHTVTFQNLSLRASSKAIDVSYVTCTFFLCDFCLLLIVLFHAFQMCDK